jgi:outer membrane protein OmpA-like peptidoglycan-associated protein
MKNNVLILLVVLLCVGCAKPQPLPDIPKNPRIIERDLASQVRLFPIPQRPDRGTSRSEPKPVLDSSAVALPVNPVCATEEVTEAPSAKVQRPERPKLPKFPPLWHRDKREQPLTYEVEFCNDSADRLLSRGRAALTEAEQEIKDGDVELITLVGFSNGNTAVGNSILAAKRADYIAEQIISFGVDREKIKTMAAWSPRVTERAPAKAVKIMIVRPRGAGPSV